MIFNPTRIGGSASKSEFTVKINATGADVSIGGTFYSGERTIKVSKNTLIAISISNTSSQVDPLTFNGKTVASPTISSNRRSLGYIYPVLQDCEVKTWTTGTSFLQTYYQTITTE